MREIADELVRTGCYIKTDHSFRTTYGDQVLAYLCCRLAISNVEVRKKFIDELARNIYEQYGSNVTVAGMATAGIPWAAGVAERLDSPLLYLRSKPKDYGLKSLIEGNLKYATDRIVVMDDVLYTGQTAQVGIDALKEKDFDVVGLSVIAKLSENAERKFTDNGMSVGYLTDFNELLDAALDQRLLNEEEKAKMLKLYKNN